MSIVLCSWSFGPPLSLVLWFPNVPGRLVPHCPWFSGSPLSLVLWFLLSLGPLVPLFTLVLWSPIVPMVLCSLFFPGPLVLHIVPCSRVPLLSLVLWSPIIPGSVVPLLSLVLWSSFCPWYLWSPYCPCSSGPSIVLGSFGPLDVPELTCKKLIFLLYTESIVGSMVYIPVVLIPVSSVYILLNYQEQEKEV